MGPKPSKKLKFKEYKPPRHHHFLYIHEPWPYENSMGSATNRRSYCNSVVGWLAVMIKDLCGIEIHTSQVVIFWQSAHRDIIAEIEIPPSEQFPQPSLDPLLGAHHSSLFLTKEWAMPEDRISTIYYYNFKFQNHPEQRNWTNSEATYGTTRELPAHFAIRRGGRGHPPAYPHPQPTDRYKLGVTLQLPGRLIVGHPECVYPSATPDPDPQVSPPPQAPPTSFPTSPRRRTTSPPPRSVSVPPTEPQLSRVSPSPEPPAPSEFAFTPYEHPLHFPRDAAAHASPGPASTSRSGSATPAAKRKRDPYEEDEDALAHLHYSPAHDIDTEEPDDVDVKIKLESGLIKGESPPPDAAEAFLKENFERVQAMLSGNTNSAPSPAKTKRDPYEEDGDALAHLHYPPAHVEPDDVDVKIKLESGLIKGESPPPDAADAFLKENFARVQAMLSGNTNSAPSPAKTKRDPYEEDGDALAHLHYSPAHVEPDDVDVRIKLESGLIKGESLPPDAADAFLKENFERVQATLSENTNSAPSSQLSAHAPASTYANAGVRIKPEPVEVKLEPELDRDHADARRWIKNEEGSARVKVESELVRPITKRPRNRATRLP